MMLEEDDRTWIREEIRRSEDRLADKILIVEKEVTGHQGDRFAHGWDHHLLERSQIEREEWMTWRSAQDKWRWLMTGAVTITAFEVPLVATLVVALWNHH